MRRIDNKIQAGDKSLKVFDRSWLFDFSNSEGGKLQLRKSCYYLLTLEKSCAIVLIFLLLNHIEVYTKLNRIMNINMTLSLMSLQNLMAINKIENEMKNHLYCFKHHKETVSCLRQ